jgi:KUP system potassium uptake protein
MSHPPPDRARLALLSLGALGVVYGDIGTSPLYALRECFHGPHAVPVTPANVLGVLSLVIWALIVVVTLKYVVYVLRMDNDGEGGVLALTALVRRAVGRQGGAAWVTMLGLFGAALLYGDGMITPAISVLAAVEGLELATPLFTPYVLPATIGILAALFAVQRRGTGRLGVVLGPVMLLWFSTLAILGVAGIVRHPAVLAAANPLYAARFLAANGMPGFLVLGAVFLVTTGGEALYADMGHFGRRPIQLDWFAIVAPALLLQYLGQGALLLERPAAAVNPFYHLAPASALYPLVALATAATVIASQAMISGAFSLTRQAVLLGYAPRVDIVHTSAREMGQIYVPGINWGLMLATIALVLAFRSSSGLAAAYGIAVSLTMVITTLLAFVVIRRMWRWNLPAALAVTAGLLLVDLAFLGANLTKIGQGGWVPLVIGAAGYVLMSTWQWGRRWLGRAEAETRVPLDVFLADVARRRPVRAAVPAVFLTANDQGVPRSLLHNFKHNKVLHETVVLLTVVNEPVPTVPDAQRLRLEELGQGFWRVVARFGFQEDPDVPAVVAAAARSGLPVDPRRVSYFLGRDSLVFRYRRGEPWPWREAVFDFLRRNETAAPAFYRLPPGSVISLGGQLELATRPG